MPYSGPTPVATLDALLQALVTWAVANAGFTDEGNIAPPSGRSTASMYRLSKGGMYWYFMGDDALIGGASSGYIEFRMQTALPTTANYSSTAVGPAEITRAQLWRNLTGPYTAYNFFTDGLGVHVVLEVSSGVFTHLSFGKATKFGTWTGGEYTTAGYMTGYTTSGLVGYDFDSGVAPFEGGYNVSSNAGFVYNPVGAFGDYRDFAEIGYSLINSQRAQFQTLSSLNTASTTYNSGLSGPLWWCGANDVNQRAAMVPQYLLLYNATLAAQWLAGYVDGVKFLNTEFIAPKDIVEVEWEVFPLTQKFGDKTVAPICGNLGLAYRRA